MTQKINCVLLVDDDHATNFLNEQMIAAAGFADIVITKNSGAEALDYLKNPSDPNCQMPDMIFLDLNMPVMNGWEFLKKYSQPDIPKSSRTKLIILTSSNNPADQERAKLIPEVHGFQIKPLNFSALSSIQVTYFQ